MSTTLFDRLAQGPATAAELMALLGCSQATLSRRLQALRSRVLPMGSARARRYGLLQGVRDLPAQVPVYRIDSSGEARLLGTLSQLAGGAFWFESATGDTAATRLYPDLPWWMQDLRPQGFLGRLFPQQFPGLGLPADVRLWDAGTVLYALARRGDNALGDLIVGEVAYSRWWEDREPYFDQITSQEAFEPLVQRVLQGAHPGSSAAGEQPKFLSRVADAEGKPVEALIKFSPRLDEAIGRRWSDLLISEHHALLTLRDAGFAVAESTVVQSATRTFLHLSRFDRTGPRGRLPLVSLGIADAEFNGVGSGWAPMARALAREQRLADAEVRMIERLAAFGLLIANTDMHPGNLSLFHADAERRGEGRFTLAPVYDMLPMRYAPVAGEVLMPDFRVPAPIDGLIEAYAEMRGPAGDFWRRVAADARVSEDFRRLADANADLVARS